MKRDRPSGSGSRLADPSHSSASHAARKWGWRVGCFDRRGRRSGSCFVDRGASEGESFGEEPCWYTPSARERQSRVGPEDLCADLRNRARSGETQFASSSRPVGGHQFSVLHRVRGGEVVRARHCFVDSGAFDQREQVICADPGDPLSARSDLAGHPESRKG